MDIAVMSYKSRPRAQQKNMHVSLFAFLLLGLSCGSPAHTAGSRNENVPEVPVVSPKEVDRPEPSALCERIGEIKELPFRADERGIDPVYDSFVDAGEAVVPCLITKVADTTKMPDPRSAPRYPDIDNKVGDVAFWVLLRITKRSMSEFLPSEVNKDSEDVGVYAYFTYVKKNENRLALQARLFEWYREKYGKDLRTGSR